MNNFTTLNAIIHDLLLIIRGSQVVRTEPISRIQIESWIHQYRARLIKQDLDKNKLINPDYVQTIPSLSMTADGDEFVTIDKIPNTVFRSNEDGFTWIGNVDGKEYQYMTEQRSKWHTCRRYTKGEPYVYLKSNNLYSNLSDDIEVKGVFENPMEVTRLINPAANLDSPYPIPSDMVTTLKEMIIKNELQIEASSPNDEENDSNHNIN